MIESVLFKGCGIDPKCTETVTEQLNYHINVKENIQQEDFADWSQASSGAYFQIHTRPLMNTFHFNVAVFVAFCLGNRSEYIIM